MFVYILILIIIKKKAASFGVYTRPTQDNVRIFLKLHALVSECMGKDTKKDINLHLAIVYKIINNFRDIFSFDSHLIVKH
jgi:hypothetical protein